MTADERLCVQGEQSAPLLAEVKGWLDDHRAQTLPKSAIGQAIRYALNQWQPLNVLLRDGRLLIHNNDTERDLRRLTIGRKNWLFLGSEAGGEVAARRYTITGSVHRHQLDMWAYLDDVLRQMAGGEGDLESLLPDAWAQTHPDSIRVYRQRESLTRSAKTKARRVRRRLQAR